MQECQTSGWDVIRRASWAAALGCVTWVGCGQGPLPPRELAWIAADRSTTEVPAAGIMPKPIAGSPTEDDEELIGAASAAMIVEDEPSAEAVANVPPVESMATTSGDGRVTRDPPSGLRLVDVRALPDRPRVDDLPLITHVLPSAQVESAAGHHPKNVPLIVSSLPGAPEAPQPPPQKMVPRSAAIEGELQEGQLPRIVGGSAAKPQVISLRDFPRRGAINPPRIAAVMRLPKIAAATTSGADDVEMLAVPAAADTPAVEAVEDGEASFGEAWRRLVQVPVMEEFPEFPAVPEFDSQADAKKEPLAGTEPLAKAETVEQNDDALPATPAVEALATAAQPPIVTRLPVDTEVEARVDRDSDIRVNRDRLASTRTERLSVAPAVNSMHRSRPSVVTTITTPTRSAPPITPIQAPVAARRVHQRTP